jgi:hypothetical protein
MTNEPYEFSPEQNKIFMPLARFMKYAALLYLLLSVVIGIFCGITIVKFPLRGSIYLFLTIINVAFGVWTNIVSYSFKQIVETTGRDIEILMEAFIILKNVYLLQFVWLLIITLLFIFILAITLFPY